MGRSIKSKVKGRFGNLLPRQRKMLEAALKGGINRTVGAVADECEIPRGTAYRWIRESEGFRTAWGTLIDESILRHAPAVTAALADKAVGGDVSGMRLFYDLAGRLKSNTVTVSNRVEVNAEDAANTEIARRARFLYSQWLKYGGEPPPEWCIRACAKMDAEQAERARQVERIAGVRPVLEAEPQPRPEVARTLLEMAQAAEVPRDDNGLALGTDYGENALPAAVVPEVKTIRD